MKLLIKYGMTFSSKDSKILFSSNVDLTVYFDK